MQLDHSYAILFPVLWKYRFILIYTGKMCSSCLYRRHVVTKGCFLLSSLTLIVASCLFLYRIDHSSEIRCVRRVYQPCLGKGDWEVNRKWEIIFRCNLLLIYSILTIILWLLFNFIDIAQWFRLFFHSLFDKIE